MFQSRISVIEGHNRDHRTDQLYQPLRKTFLEDTTAKKTYLEDVSRISNLSHNAKIHTYVQNLRLGQQTLIPQDIRLRPSHDLSKVPINRKFYIVNAQQRIGQPISAQELQQRLKGKDYQEQVIVYTYGDQEQVKIQKKQKKQEKVQARPFSLPKKPRSSYLKVTQPKYNLFSIIDEPLNSIFSGGPCTCPANQIIASQRNQINWENAKKYD